MVIMWQGGGDRVACGDAVFVSVIGSHVSAKLQPWSPTFSARRWSLQSADKKDRGEERFREDEDVKLRFLFSLF